MHPAASDMHADMAMRRSPCSTPTYARTLPKQNAGATLCRTGSPLGRLGCAEGHRTARTTRPAIAPACDAHAAATHGCACKRSPHSCPPQLGDEGDELKHHLDYLRLHAVGGVLQPEICRDAACHKSSTRISGSQVRQMEKWAQVANAAGSSCASRRPCLTRARTDAVRTGAGARAKVGRYVAGWQSWHRALAEAYQRRPR